MAVDHLNPLPDFDVSTRSVRDRFNTWQKSSKPEWQRRRVELGGGGEELSEMESLLEELITELDKRRIREWKRKQ